VAPGIWLAEKRAGRIEHGGRGSRGRRRRRLNRVWIGVAVVGPGPADPGGRIGGFSNMLGRAKNTKSTGWRSLPWSLPFFFIEKLLYRPLENTQTGFFP